MEQKKMKKSTINTGNEQLMAYYKAAKIARRNNKVLVFSNIVLVIGIVIISMWSTMSVNVAVPGQNIKASKAFSNPYAAYNAEERVVEFTQHMLTFDPLNFEKRTKEAEKWAVPSVYDKYYSLYYVDRDSETNKPLYMTYLENAYQMDVEIFDLTSTENGDGSFIVEFEFVQRLVKIEDTSRGTEARFRAAAKVKEMPYSNSDNRTGMVITQLEMEKV